MRCTRNCAISVRSCGSRKYGVWAMARHADVYADAQRLGNLLFERRRRHGEFPHRETVAAAEPDPRGRSAAAHAHAGGALAGAVEHGHAPHARYVRDARRGAGRPAGRPRPVRRDDRLRERLPAGSLSGRGRLDQRRPREPGALRQRGFQRDGPTDGALFASAMQDAARVGPWILAQCRRDALAPGGLGADVYASVDSGEIDRRRGRAARALAAFGGARHDRTRHRQRALLRSSTIPISGRCCTQTRRSLARRSKRRCGSSRR